MLDLPRDELVSFASAVTGRFRNPYIKHQLLSIALNGMTKYRTRILPQLLAGRKRMARCRRVDLAGGADRLYRESGMVRAIQYRMTPTGYRAIKRCGPPSRWPDEHSRAGHRRAQRGGSLAAGSEPDRGWWSW